MSALQMEGLGMCLAHYAGQATDFETFDCARFALDVLGGGPGTGADLAARHGLSLTYAGPAEAMRTVRRFSRTLGEAVVKICQAEGLRPVSPKEAGTGAIGIAAAKSAFGATICVCYPQHWLTVTGPEGLCAVEDSDVLAAWA